MTRRTNVQRPNGRRIVGALITAAALCVAVSASAQKPPVGTTTGTAPETWTISRAAWIGEMSAALPDALCAHPYFASCFSTTPSECAQYAATATEACLGMFANSLPEVFNQPNDGAMWGEQIGECTGTRLEQEMMPSFTNTPQCNDPSLWL